MLKMLRDYSFILEGEGLATAIGLRRPRHVTIRAKLARTVELHEKPVIS